MSGICGILSFDGGDPDVAPILALLERRGPDGTHCWADGPVALGHTLLATTPEALVEVLPLTEPDSGCTITADARIDNRDELIAALDLGGETRVIGDGELILRAYLKWGEECPTHLLGDFAFAIWDPREDRLFCARDHMGMRQFNYCHVPGQVFAFATIDTALLALDSVPRAINEPRIADFITDCEGYDHTSTFFEKIHRLAPAHSLTVANGQSGTRRYWTLKPGPPLDLSNDTAYAAAFLDVFTEAVRCRLRSVGGVGAMVSGGLDSSSVVAVAAAILSQTGKPALKTLSAVDPQAANCPETVSIETMLALEGLDPIRINKSDFGRKRDILIAEMDDVRNPFEVHMTMLRSIYLCAQDQGLNVVLDGGAGDVILTSNNMVAAHIAKGRFRKAWQEAWAARAFWKIQQPSRYLVEQLLSGAWVAFVPVAIRSRWRSYRMTKPLPAISPQFAQRVDFNARQRVADEHVSMAVRGEADKRAQSIVHPNLASGRERYDQVAGSFGVESRDPFMDLRVIQFCLSLPTKQLQDRGWPKIILRRAIESKVGRVIAWRKGKEHLGGDFTNGLIATWPEWSDSMNETNSPLAGFVSSEAISNLRAFRFAVPTPFAVRMYALDRFLRRYDARAESLKLES